MKIKKVIISTIIIIIIIFAIFLSGCIDPIGSKENKKDYLYSTYIFFLNFEIISDNQITIQIPFPTQTCDFGLPQGFKSVTIESILDTEGKMAPHGNTMELKFNIKEFYENNSDEFWAQCIWWHYEMSIFTSSFSTQVINDTNKIWIYLNESDYLGNINFYLIKKDWWDTENWDYCQWKYCGVMDGSLPSEFKSEADSWKFMSKNSVELKEDWNNYSLIQGKCNYYSPSD